MTTKTSARQFFQHPAAKASSLFGMFFILAGSGCPLIPDIEEKIVELAVGASIIVPFEARGIINQKGEEECFILDDEIDIGEILEDADVDVSDVQAISLSGVSYRITKADENPARMIENSTVTISYLADGPSPLLTNFSDSAGAVTEFKTAALDAAGVGLVNDMLADLLTAVQTNSSSDVNGCVTWTGQSTPVDENTNFDWEIKLDLTIVGEIEVEVPS